MIDTLVALMLTGLLAGVVFHTRVERKMDEKIVLARAEVRRFQSQLNLQAALEKVELTQRGYPATVEPEWFLGDLPANPLLGPGHPWLEIAGKAHSNLDHPELRTASDHSVAQFWYNPYRGSLRARVPSGISDATALELYNRINECNLTSLVSAGKAGLSAP
ncbi:MAG: hypothetical protein ACYS0G_14410 [Planctomycetota bacterium]